MRLSQTPAGLTVSGNENKLVLLILTLCGSLNGKDLLLIGD